MNITLYNPRLEFWLSSPRLPFPPIILIIWAMEELVR